MPIHLLLTVYVICVTIETSIISGWCTRFRVSTEIINTEVMKFFPTKYVVELIYSQFIFGQLLFLMLGLWSNCSMKPA